MAVLRIMKYLRYLPLLVAFVRNIMEMIREAEDLIEGEKKGPWKKKLTMTILRQALDLAAAFGIGNMSKERRDALENEVSHTIDALVEVANEVGILKPAEQPNA